MGSSKKKKQHTMHYNPGQSDFSPTGAPNLKAKHRIHSEQDEVLFPKSSTCVQSTSSQDPVHTRSDLSLKMHHISAFALHYAAMYYAIGTRYHELPFSARNSEWIVPAMRDKTNKALTASFYRQLPDLVCIFIELSYRLNESSWLLFGVDGDWQASEMQLRRCDMLMQEAELRLRFVQNAVWNMEFTVGRDEAVNGDEGEEMERARVAFKQRWVSILPQICFNATEPGKVVVVEAQPEK